MLLPRKIVDTDLKSEYCKRILRSLPLWFGIETAIIDYVKDVREMETWAVFDNSEAIGFASVNRHFPQTAEIRSLGRGTSIVLLETNTSF